VNEVKVEVEPKVDAARPEAGTLTVQSDVLAVVEASGRKLGMTPLTIQLPAGRHHLTLRPAGGGRATSVDVEVPAGGKVRRQVKLR
jgi:hypothetical protein